MDTVPRDDFVVFIRSDRGDGSSPDAVEWPLASCASYEDARRVREAFADRSGECVIRFLGDTGGGD
jgi:hypothetical protein